MVFVGGWFEECEVCTHFNLKFKSEVFEAHR